MNPFVFGFAGGTFVRARRYSIERLDAVANGVIVGIDRPGALDADNELLFGMTRGGVGCWHLGSGEQVRVWPVTGVVALAVHGRRRRFAVTDERGEISVWSYDRESALHRGTAPTGTQSLSFDAEGARLAAAAGDVVTILDVETLAPGVTMRGHGATVNAMTFHPDGTRLATASDDTTVRLWDTASGALVLVFDEPRFAMRCVAFSADGRRLAGAGGSWDSLSPVWLWELP